jgi:site-specific DNA-adenine methylase
MYRRIIAQEGPPGPGSRGSRRYPHSQTGNCLSQTNATTTTVKSVGSMQLRPFFSYYGGKWRDTPKHYAPPKHDTIVEPFAGSAGYSLRYPERRVVLCELDPLLVSLWRYLIKVNPKEILAIPDVPLDGSVDDLKLTPEESWLVGFWLNRGTARPRKHPSRWMREQIRPGSFWGQRVRETIARQVERIRHWEVLDGGYEKCHIRRKATWFVDPPYQEAGCHYKYGPAYVDYDHLADWCKSRRGQVIVCENSGAKWLPFKELTTTKTTRTGRRSSEAVWTPRSRSRVSAEVAAT